MATTIRGRTLAAEERRTRGDEGFGGRWLGFLRRLARNKGAFASAIVLIALVVVSVDAVGSRLAPADPTQMLVGPKLAAPSGDHLMGTDQYGRDILSRTIYGGRLTISSSLFGVVLAAAIGIVAGLLAGYLAGWIDSLIMRLVDIMLAFPGILLTLAVVAVLGPGLKNIQIAVGISLIPPFVRLVRGSVLSAKNDEYVVAATTIGCRPLRVMFRHILPNVTTSILVLFTTAIGWAIIIASSLSFLGLGVNPPEAEWGADMKQALTYLNQGWWMAFPGFAITVTIIAVNLFGDGLQDALDPYTKRKG
ncbi:MAG: peptide/nickel transport system permease protein [Thermomicrobiales bacterium]|jgi:ABC-type dipeptide/oligopeptide/nickel transport system permease subunit|nr:peptide/nickel transport system permease protein [Thermomicrobiales bacterium]